MSYKTNRQEDSNFLPFLNPRYLYIPIQSLLTLYKAFRLKLVAYQAFEVPDLNLGLGAVFLP